MSVFSSGTLSLFPLFSYTFRLRTPLFNIFFLGYFCNLQGHKELRPKFGESDSCTQPDQPRRWKRNTGRPELRLQLLGLLTHYVDPRHEADTRHVAPDTSHLKPDTWHLIPDTWPYCAATRRKTAPIHHPSNNHSIPNAPSRACPISRKKIVKTLLNLAMSGPLKRKICPNADFPVGSALPCLDLRTPNPQGEGAGPQRRKADLTGQLTSDGSGSATQPGPIVFSEGSSRQAIRFSVESREKAKGGISEELCPARGRKETPSCSP
jgi:hypothetical protein